MNDTNYATVTWEKLLGSLLDEGTIPQMSYENWFKPSQAIEMDSKSLTVEASDDFSMAWMKDNYTEILEKHLAELLGTPLRIFFKVRDAIPNVPIQALQQTPSPALGLQNGFSQDFSYQQQPQTAYQEQGYQQQPSQSQREHYPQTDMAFTPAKSIQQQIPQQLAPASERAKNAYLNPTLTFDNFVSGSSNQLAYHVAQAVADNPGVAHNPMFLYGGSGLGKTHLIQAIGNEIIQRHPNKEVLYVTSETFLSDYVSSIRSERTESFRSKYRKIDVLIIDDIQFFVGKEGIQEEFFHTFNDLHSMNKQIIITSDSQPNELTTLTERLRSRFNWGILTDIQPPELETRMAILQKKISSLSSLSGDNDVPAEVIEYIASNVDTNVRDLEGALNGLIAHSVMLGQMDITLNLAVEALRSFTKKESQKISIARIQKIVAKYYSIHVDDLKSKSRKEPLTTYRHISIYLCKQLTPNSLQNIGKHYGRRDHTTIMNSIRKIETLITRDPDIVAVLEELEKQIVVN